MALFASLNDFLKWVFFTVHAVYAVAERADTLPLFLLHPYMYSVEYSMSGTSEHNKAKSRNHIAYNFPMLLLFCIQLYREQLVVSSTENTYVHQAIFLLAEKACRVHTGKQSSLDLVYLWANFLHIIVTSLQNHCRTALSKLFIYVLYVPLYILNASYACR